jgi:predicted nucleic acid-binding Zn ribbon protein
MARRNRGEQKPRSRSEPAAIQAVLSSALSKFGLDKEIARYEFVLRWPEIVGQGIAARTKPECIRNGALVVRVCNSAWCQELSFRKDAILQRLNKMAAATGSGDQELVHDVQFYVGDIS